MTYFIDPYKKYYNVLSGASGLGDAASLVSNKVSESGEIVGKLNSSISNSEWNELGIKELEQNVLPSIKANHDILTNNVTNCLAAIASKATGELLPETIKLKEEDEKYDNYKEQLENLNSVSQDDPNYSSYVNTKSELQTKMNESKTKCEEYIRNCNSIVSSIQALDSAATDFSVAVVSTGGGGNTLSVIESVEGGNMLKITCNGKEYYVANTRISVIEYQEYIEKVGLCQNSGFMPSECSTLSQVYACDLMRGTYTARSDDAVQAQSPCTRVGATCESTNKDDVLKYIYDEITNGRVVTLQATQVNTTVDGSRHVVTVVGFDSSVKSWKDINKDTLLVLDCVDGKIQTLGQSRESGGHERDFYQMGNSRGSRTYLVHGATDEFLSKEVENAEWQAKRGKGRTTVA